MAEDGRVQVFTSLDSLQEIRRVLEYEKILRILKSSQREPSSIMTSIVSLCSLVDVKATVRAIKDDPSDNHILACAREANAHFIVSGDSHLLKLGQYENIRILAASSFLEMQRIPRSRA